MAGLQGSGKTTTVGKLAKRFKEKGKNCLLVPADVYRPAAIEQLHVLGRDLSVAVYDGGDEKDPIAICKKALDEAINKMSQVVIIDTAGRQQVDDDLMGEFEANQGNGASSRSVVCCRCNDGPAGRRNCKKRLTMRLALMASF